MLKAIAVLVGATALHTVTMLLETRSSTAGDLIRLAAFVGALSFVISVAPCTRERARRVQLDDERFAGVDRRVVTLSLRSSQSGRRHARGVVPAE